MLGRDDCRRAREEPGFQSWQRYLHSPISLHGITKHKDNFKLSLPVSMYVTRGVAQTEGRLKISEKRVLRRTCETARERERGRGELHREELQMKDGKINGACNTHKKDQ
jgi:hypothetical protein